MKTKQSKKNKTIKKTKTTKTKHNTTIKRKKGFQLPKKIVLVITTHGHLRYPFREFKNPLNSITNVKIAPVGECNFMDKNDAENLLSNIHTYIPNLLNSNEPEENKIWIDSIVNQFLDIQQAKMNSMLKEMNDTDTFGFYRKFKNPRDIRTIINNENVINKFYLNDTPGQFPYGVFALFVDEQGNTKQIDIFDFVTKFISDTQISLQQIIEYLKQKGVDDVIIFDFTCDVYFRNDKRASDRETRSIRREYMSNIKP